MAHTAFHADVLTPEGQLFADEVQQISTRTVVGELGILARHVPLLGRLEPSELRLYREGDDVVRFVQGGGYVQVDQDGNVLILTDEAFPVEEYDRERAERRQSDAAERLDAAKEGTEAHRLATRAKRRADLLVALDERLER